MASLGKASSLSRVTSKRAALDSRDGGSQSNSCALSRVETSPSFSSTPVSRIQAHCLESRRSWTRGDESSRRRRAREWTLRRYTICERGLWCTSPDEELLPPPAPRDCCAH